MDINIHDFRTDFDKLGSQYKLADNIGIQEEIIDGIHCYWIYTEDARSHSSATIYLHGGCYVAGSINSHKALVSHLANELDKTFLFIEYSLAPEHPFSEAVNEIIKVYNYLVKQLNFSHISLIGDSAGGGLITSVISILNKGKNAGNLGRIIMISPWVDLRNNNDSIEQNRAIDPVLNKESLDFFASLYIGQNKLSDINPIETIFGLFPPTFILVGSNEILLDDSKMMYSKIAIGQPVTKITIYENQTHVWLMSDIYSESSKEAINEIRQFMNSEGEHSKNNL